MSEGYPNASKISIREHDHAYNVLPFVFGENKEEGFIIADPTSDQLFNGDYRPRNLILVVPKNQWNYITDWKNGANLSPKGDGWSSTFSNLSSLRNQPPTFSEVYEEVDFNHFSQEVFKNPIDVNMETRE